MKYKRLLQVMTIAAALTGISMGQVADAEGEVKLYDSEGELKLYNVDCHLVFEDFVKVDVWDRTAMASAYEAYSCSAGATCNETYTLGNSGTIEFRGSCPGNTLPATQTCSSGGNSYVTCTATFNWFGYSTCSCTNWGVNNATAQMTFRCRQPVEF